MYLFILHITFYICFTPLHPYSSFFILKNLPFMSYVKVLFCLIPSWLTLHLEFYSHYTDQLWSENLFYLFIFYNLFLNWSGLVEKCMKTINYLCKKNKRWILFNIIEVPREDLCDQIGRATRISFAFILITFPRM